jgi:hypothetical protein
MNERIRELKNQAWTLVSEEERARGELYEAREQWERCDQKFAELIVRECQTVVEWAISVDSTIDRVPNLIKEHFGVEE